MSGSNLRDFDWLRALGEGAAHSGAGTSLRYSPQNMVNCSCDERRICVGPCHSFKRWIQGHLPKRKSTIVLQSFPLTLAKRGHLELIPAVIQPYSLTLY